MSWTSTALRSGLWLLLGGWLGAWILFALVVAPVTFSTIPAESAGALVGPVLTALHLYGAAAGLALALLARVQGRGPWLVLLPGVMALICLISHFGVTAEIDRIHPLAFGPEGSPEAAARFWRLHGISMALYTAVGLLAFVLLVLHARAETTGDRRGETTSAPAVG